MRTPSLDLFHIMGRRKKILPYLAGFSAIPHPRAVFRQVIAYYQSLPNTYPMPAPLWFRSIDLDSIPPWASHTSATHSQHLKSFNLVLERFIFLSEIPIALLQEDDILGSLAEDGCLVELMRGRETT